MSLREGDRFLREWTSEVREQLVVVVLEQMIFLARRALSGWTPAS